MQVAGMATRKAARGVRTLLVHVANFSFGKTDMTPAHFLASFAFAYILYSLSEYSVHRFAMHRMKLAKALKSNTLRDMVINHMGKHHKRGYHHDTHDEDDKLWHMQIAGLVPVAIVTVPVYFVDPATSWVIFGFGVVYASVWWLVHYEMHRSEGRFFARTSWFLYLEAQHQLHHEFPNTNYNVILPFGDWLFGTRPTASQLAELAAGNRRKTTNPKEG